MKKLVAAFACVAMLAGCAGMGPFGGQSGAQATVVDDATLNTQVKAALSADPDLAGQKINVAIDKGTVSLKGEIKTLALRRKAETLVRGVKGVKTVNNQLVVTG